MGQPNSFKKAEGHGQTHRISGSFQSLFLFLCSVDIELKAEAIHGLPIRKLYLG